MGLVDGRVIPHCKIVSPLRILYSEKQREAVCRAQIRQTQEAGDIGALSVISISSVDQVANGNEGQTNIMEEAL